MLDREIVVTEIALALFVPAGQGRPSHRDRKAHGLVFNVGCTSVYRFEGGDSLTCRDGDCLYLPKGSNYTVCTVPTAEHGETGSYAINFLMLSEEASPPWVMRLSGTSETASLFSKAAKAWLRKDVGFYEECFSCLYRILQRVKRESARYFPKQKSMELLAPALRYVNEHYAEEGISVAHLAHLCDVSEVYLRRVFRRVFGVSPAVYMRNRRIDYAKELLCTEEYSVTDVAMLSGFNDTAYFAREFKRVVGVTPSVYRKDSPKTAGALPDGVRGR